jgi:sulfhydrogenase subunit alpha
LQEAEALLRWLVTIELPQLEREFVSVALSEGEAYPMIGETIVSDQGLELPIAQFEQHFEELQVAHSTAFHALLDGHPYLVGPLARVNLHHQRLHPAVISLCEELEIRFPSRNMFDSVLARGVELLQALHEAVVLLQQYRQPEQSWTPFVPRAGVAYGATCAPRGILWHRYQLDAEGVIESDLRESLTRFGLQSEEEALKRFGEQVIRNYDPCISCATHFLDLRLERR